MLVCKQLFFEAFQKRIFKIKSTFHKSGFLKNKDLKTFNKKMTTNQGGFLKIFFSNGH